MAQKAVIWAKTAVRQRKDVLRYWTVRNGSGTFCIKLVKSIRKNIDTIRK